MNTKKTKKWVQQLLKFEFYGKNFNKNIKLYFFVINCNFF